MTPQAHPGFKRVVVIAGVARSGASWLGEILDSSPDVAYRFQPIFSYAFKDAVNDDSRVTDFERFFDGIYKSNDAFLLQAEKRDSGLYPTFAKLSEPGYLVWKEARYQYLLGRMVRFFPTLKVIAIVRHPCAVISSWLRNPKEFPPGSDPRAEWRFGACKNQGQQENFFGYYKWKEAAHLYLDLQQQYPNQVRVVRYCDLVDHTESTVAGIFEFIGLPITDQSMRFIKASNSTHKESPYSVYKDKSVKDQWKKQLDPYIAEEIVADIRGTSLETFLE